MNTDRQSSRSSQPGVRGVLRRQAIKSSLVFLAALSVVAGALVFWSNTYRSDAQIFVRLGRESVSLDPTVTAAGTITVNETREVEINSILEVLRSRSLAERVVDEVGVEVVLSGKPADTDDEDEDDDGGSRASAWIGETIDRVRLLKDGRAVSRRERAVTALLRNLNVWSPKRTTVIGIEYKTDSPEVAQQVVSQVIEAFRDEHARVNRTEGSYLFLAEQTQVLEEKLIEAQSRLRDEKSEMGIVNIEGHRRILQDELAMLETQLMNARSDLSGSRAKVASLMITIGELPERMLTEGVIVANAATDQMRDTLYQLQVRERELLAKYKEGHPLLNAIREQAREAQAIYEEQSGEREQTTTGVHPARQQLELALLTENALVDALVARIGTLEQQHSEALARMAKLNAQEVRLAELQRKSDLAEASFKVYADRTEQARLDQQLENRRISNVNVVQPASFLEKPAGPNRLLVLVLGVFFAGLCSIGTAILGEMSRRPMPLAQNVLPEEPLHEESLQEESPRSGVTSRRPQVTYR